MFKFEFNRILFFIIIIFLIKKNAKIMYTYLNIKNIKLKTNLILNYLFYHNIIIFIPNMILSNFNYFINILKFYIYVLRMPNL